MPSPADILEKLRLASVQHGAAVKQIIADINVLGARLNALEEGHQQLVADVQALAGAQAQVDDEAGGQHDEAAAEQDGEDEEDAEFEEA